MFGFVELRVRHGSIRVYHFLMMRISKSCVWRIDGFFVKSLDKLRDISQNCTLACRVGGLL